MCSRWARTDAEVTLTSSCASACSARRQRSTFSATGTANGSRSNGVRNSPRAGSSGRELAAVAARRGLREGGRLASGRLGALLVEPPVAGEPPGAADEHAHADPLGLLVVEPLDAAVPRSDHLRAAHDDARIRVRGPGAECGGHGVLAKLPHRLVP